jgi:hypothetical protein
MMVVQKQAASSGQGKFIFSALNVNKNGGNNKLGKQRPAAM